MTGRTGYTELDNGLPPEGPDQMNGIYEHFDPLIGETVAAAGDLPSSDNWPGRTIYVQADSSVRVWSGSGWVLMASSATTPGSIVPAPGGSFTLSNNQLYFRDGWVLGSIDWVKSSGTLGHADVICIMPAGFRPQHEYVVQMTAAPSPTVIGQIVVTAGTGEMRALSPVAGRTTGSLKVMYPLP